MRRGISFLRTLWRNQRQRPVLPRFLTYLVTFACNARCVMCDSWRKSSKNDLTTTDIAKIFNQLPRIDAVRLTGGEPFLRKDLLEIAHLVQENLRPLVLHITTNGFLTECIVTFCEQRRKDIPLRLLVSLDGVAEKHDRVRGVKGAWGKAVATLKALAPRQKQLRIRLVVNQTITDPEGAKHYTLLRDFLRPLGIRNYVVMAYDVSAIYGVDMEVNVAPRHSGQFTPLGEFSATDLRELLDSVRRDLRSYPLPDRLAKSYYLKGLRNRLLLGNASPNPRCVALSSHLRLLPDGSIPTCQFNMITVGKLPNQHFRDVWFGQRIAKQRDWVRKCPGCWAECEIIPNAIYTGDLIRESLILPVHGLLTHWPAGASNERVTDVVTS